MKRLTLLPLGLFLLLPTVSRAADLTWEDCLKEAAQNNQDLIRSREAVRAARFGKDSVYGKFLPSLSAGANVGSSGNEGSLAGALHDPDASPSSGINLSAQLNLFNGLKDKASLDAAQAALDGAQASLQQERAQLSHDLKYAFAGLLYTQQQVGLLTGIADRQHQNENMVKLHYKGGQENKGSYLNAQASSASADVDILQARRAVRLAQRKLDRLLGRSLLDSPTVTGDFNVPAPDGTPNFLDLAKTAPAYLSAQANLKSAKSQVGSATGQFLPSLNASGSIGRSGTTWPPQQDGWTAGLSLSYPLFSGGQDAFNLMGAKSRKKQAEISLATTLQDTAVSLENVFWNLCNALEQTVVQKKFLDATSVQEEIAKAQYNNGLLSYQDWSLVENSLNSSEKSNLQALLGAKTAEADWELAQGKDELP